MKQTLRRPWHRFASLRTESAAIHAPSTALTEEASMDAIRDVAVLVGSLRQDSINRKVANALADLAPPPLKLTIIEIGQLPLYNQDYDSQPPAAWTAFRERLRAGRCGPVRHARAQPRSTRRSEKCVGRGLTPIRPQRLERQARCRGHRFARRDRRVWSESPPPAIARFSERTGDAAAGGLSRRSGQAVRCKRQPHRDRTRTFLQTFMQAYAAWVTAHVTSR